MPDDTLIWLKFRISDSERKMAQIAALNETDGKKGHWLRWCREAFVRGCALNNLKKRK